MSNGYFEPNTLVLLQDYMVGYPYETYMGFGKYDGPPPADLNFQRLDFDGESFGALLSILRSNNSYVNVVQGFTAWILY